jgi:hypothetical protein
MKLRKTPPTKGLVAVVWHDLLGFFISSRSGQRRFSPASSNSPQMILEALPNDQTEHKMACSLQATGPQGIHPSHPIKAILWLFGRPWYGRWSAGWPEIILLPRDASRKHLPLPIWLLARTWLCIVPSAKPLDSSCVQQASILLHEIQSLLCGRRGKRRRDHTSSHRNRVHSCRSLELAMRYRKSNGLEPANPLMVDVGGSSFFLPNV